MITTKRPDLHYFASRARKQAWPNRFWKLSESCTAGGDIHVSGKVHCITLPKGFGAPLATSHIWRPSYITNWIGRVLLQKLAGLQLAKKAFEFYGTRRFITPLTDHHLSASRRQIKPVPIPLLQDSVSYYAPIYVAVFQAVSFPQISPNPGCTSPVSHTRYIHSPSQSSWFDHLKNIWWEVQIIKLLSCTFLHSLVTSTLLGPNIFLSTLSSTHTKPMSALHKRNDTYQQTWCIQ
jgi:hypothetical protein